MRQWIFSTPFGHNIISLGQYLVHFFKKKLIINNNLLILNKKVCVDLRLKVLSNLLYLKMMVKFSKFNQTLF